MTSRRIQYIIDLAGNLSEQARRYARSLTDLQRSALTMNNRLAAGNARERLGIRSERAIQREIMQTMAAYRRLERAGQSSSRELARAAEQMRQRVSALRREMGQTSLAARGIGMIKGAAGVGVGLAAGGMVAKSMLEKPMAYDRMLADMSNTAFADRDKAGRIAGMKDLNQTIVEATKNGGGTRENTAAALNTLLSSGQFNDQELKKILPAIIKGSTAGNVNAEAMANIALAAKQNLGLSADEIPIAISKALLAGQKGGFELKDMAKWLPELLATYNGTAGAKGMGAFEEMIVMAQAAKTTAGSTDGAGNNLLNLLTKINSTDTAKDFKKLGIDLTGSLAASREKGTAPLQAFMGLVDKVMAKDKRYTDLKSKAEKMDDGNAKKAVLEQMAGIVSGSAIGQVIQDRQALLALLGMQNQKEQSRKILGDVQNEKTNAVDVAQSVIAETASYKTEQVGLRKDDATNNLFNAMEGPLKGVMDGMIGLADEYPGLTTATVGVTGALTVLMASAGALGAAQMLLAGRMAAGGGLGLGAAGGLAGAARLGGQGLALGAALTAGYGVGTVINDGIDAATRKMTGRDESLGSWLSGVLGEDEAAKKALAPTILKRRNADNTPATQPTPATPTAAATSPATPPQLRPIFMPPKLPVVPQAPQPQAAQPTPPQPPRPHVQAQAAQAKINLELTPPMQQTRQPQPTQRAQTTQPAPAKILLPPMPPAQPVPQAQSVPPMRMPQTRLTPSTQTTQTAQRPQAQPAPAKIFLPPTPPAQPAQPTQITWQQTRALPPMPMPPTPLMQAAPPQFRSYFTPPAPARVEQARINTDAIVARANQTPPPPQKVEIGEGRIKVDSVVRVEGNLAPMTTATTTATMQQPLKHIQLDGGNTRPGAPVR